MSKVTTAGEWRIELTDPYPVVAYIYRGDQEIARCSHHELADLRYVVDRSMDKARMLLGKDAGEV